MSFKKSAIVLAASLLAITAQAATTFTNSTNVGVTINVTAASTTTACNFSGPATLFTNATYTSGPAAAQVNGFSNNVSIACDGTSATPYEISAGAGMNASTTSRRAKSGVNFIDYKLTSGFVMTGPAPIWDDATTPLFGGIAGTGTTSGGATNSGNLNFQLVVPGLQSAPTGTYTDTVLVTATF